MGEERGRANIGPSEPATADPLVGTELAGSYRVTRLLATGGMGRLYEAEHTRIDKKLVVKLLLEAHSLNREVLERAEREARAIGAIRSEHVVRVVDVIRLPDGRPATVTEHLEGEDLAERLSRVTKLPVGEAARIARQICEGAEAAHAAGIVHRDLKPANVFLATSPDGDLAKILDFGIAKIAGSASLTETGALVGTPAYMAPEQASGAGNVDVRADVYAIGAVLYHMLTGSPPYGDEDTTVTLMKLLKGEPPRARSLDRDIPEALEALLERAMARDRGLRTPSARQLADELAVFDDAAPRARDRTARTRSDLATRRGPGRLASVLLLGASLVVLAAWTAALSALAPLAIRRLASSARTARRASARRAHRRRGARPLARHSRDRDPMAELAGD